MGRKYARNPHALKSVKYPGRPMHVAELYGVLGLSKARLPDAGLAPQIIQGVLIWVVPRTTKQQFIRTFCQCPGCSRTLTLKNLNQHICGAERRHEHGGPEATGEDYE